MPIRDIHACTHTLTRSLKETCQERMNEKVVFQCIQSVSQSLHCFATHLNTTNMYCIQRQNHEKLCKLMRFWGYVLHTHTHTERINDALSFIKQNRRLKLLDLNRMCLFAIYRTVMRMIQGVCKQVCIAIIMHADASTHPSTRMFDAGAFIINTVIIKLISIRRVRSRFLFRSSCLLRHTNKENSSIISRSGLDWCIYLSVHIIIINQHNL